MKPKKPPKFQKGDLVKLKGRLARLSHLEPDDLEKFRAAVWIITGDRYGPGWYTVKADLDLDGTWTIFHADCKQLELVYEL